VHLAAENTITRREKVSHKSGTEEVVLFPLRPGARLTSDLKFRGKRVEVMNAGFAAKCAYEVNVVDHRPDNNGPLIQIHSVEKLEEEIKSEFYEWRKGKAWFSEEMKREHRKLRTSLFQYFLHSRFMAFLTSPFIYICIIPFAMLDLFISIYQGVCFPVYGIPKARRRDYMAIDRGSLQYLNALEKLNCVYCSYANGLLAYVVEIAGRTEQHWCPIKHARRVQHTHDRYSHFLPYGDAPAYRKQVDEVRDDFADLKQRK
jgi:hypothetical protein